MERLQAGQMRARPQTGHALVADRIAVQVQPLEAGQVSAGGEERGVAAVQMVEAEVQAAQRGEFRPFEDRGDVAEHAAEFDRPDRRPVEQGAGVGEERLGHNEDVVDKPAAKDGVRDDRRERPLPLLAVPAEQFVLAGFQFGPPRVVARQPGPFDLDANELAARIAVLVEVIGVDEPGQVVIGRGADRPQKRGVVGVHNPL